MKWLVIPQNYRIEDQSLDGSCGLCIITCDLCFFHCYEKCSDPKQ